MLKQKEFIKAIEDAGTHQQVKIMVESVPVTDSYTKEIGADGYTEDAISAVDTPFRLIDAPA